jgi:hypothetical protein
MTQPFKVSGGKFPALAFNAWATRNPSFAINAERQVTHILCVIVHLSDQTRRGGGRVGGGGGGGGGCSFAILHIGNRWI